MFENTESPATPPTAGVVQSAQPGKPVLTCRDLCDWVVRAQANARLVYAHGVQWEHCCRFELREQVLKLQRLQLVTSHFVRGRHGEPDRHLVQRTQRPYVSGMFQS